VTTQAEQSAWQRRAAALLVNLLALGATEGLPAITWTVAAAGCGLLAEAPGREHHQAWKAAITTASGSAPDVDHEVTRAHGEIRLLADWDHLPVGLAEGSGHPPRVHVTLVAASKATDSTEGVGR
jgi:hypothetical protein